MTYSSALYFGSVMHRRFKPKEHRLKYGVFSMLVDLEELPRLSEELRVFGYNRFAPLAFYDRDHGDGTDGGLRTWVTARLQSAGYNLNNGRIKLLCYPRIFGYVFNPLSVYYCYNEAGDLAVLLYEVSNTFGERHTYVIPADVGSDQMVRQSCDKRMYVSPFIPMDCRYDFAMTVPGEILSVTIDEHDAEGRLLIASFKAHRFPMSNRNLVSTFLKFPLMTFRITAAIHWQALKLWRKGISIIPHKAAGKPINSSVIHPAKTAEPVQR